MKPTGRGLPPAVFIYNQPVTRRLRDLFLSLPGRMVLSFVLLACVAALTVGVPAIVLARQELERHAWNQLNNEQVAARALFDAHQRSLSNLTRLAAQRPTLNRLLEGEAQADLPAYLEELRASSDVDAMLICDASGAARVSTGRLLSSTVCQNGAGSVISLAGNPSPEVWMVAVETMTSGSDRIAAGILMDRDFLREMRRHTGLEYLLYANGEAAVSSLRLGPEAESGVQVLPANDLPSLAGASAFAIRSSGSPYYAARFPLGAQGVEALAALPISELNQARSRFTRLLVASIAGVIGLGTFLGILFAGRISGPLARLADSAALLRRGDLARPVSVRTQVPEVDLVGYALDDARIALKGTLDELRREKAWINHLLEAVVEGIVTMDQHGRITYFSQGAEKITGWQPESAVGRSCDEVFQPTEPGLRFSQLLPPAGQRTKVELVLRNGKQAILSITGARLFPPEAGVARIALVLRDVSDEEALHRLLGDFLANIAHEFRTPLSALTASTELLLEGLPELSRAELYELLNSVRLGLLSLQTLIDNLLEGASLETGRFRVFAHPASLDEILDEAVRTMRPLLEKYKLQLRLDVSGPLPQVHADPRRTVQVLVNLLGNASKFGPADSEILLRVTQGEGIVRVAVADCGPGISPDQQMGLFQRFTHPDASPARSQVGLGLGLSVVKAIVEAQGGQVGAGNRPGGGAEFWFTLVEAKE